MKKSSLLLLLIVPTACSNFKPFVFTNAFLLPETITTNAGYDDVNWSYALFNQYASGLSYTFRMNYTNSSAFMRNNAIQYTDNLGTNYLFSDWTTITSTYAEAELNDLWRNRLNLVMFNRDFDRTTKLATSTHKMLFRKIGGIQNVNYEIIIKSKISYSVNVGSIYMSYYTNGNAGIDTFEKYIEFLNKDNQLLTQYRLVNNPAFATYNNVFNLSTITTNVNQFNIKLQWIDIPPYVVYADAFYEIREFNMFTQNQEINIPDDASGNLFGFEFVAVEWWNFLGHAQNFLWWIINKSPISPVFVWIDTYIITWFVGFFNFMEELFNL